MSVRWSNLEGIHLTAGQANTMTTELMILGAVASSAHGETVISDVTDCPGVGRDAFARLARGLEMLGTRVGNYADGIVLEGGQEMHGDLVDSGGKSDVAIALALAGLNTSGTTTVLGFDDDSYPLDAFRLIVRKLQTKL